MQQNKICPVVTITFSFLRKKIEFPDFYGLGCHLHVPLTFGAKHQRYF